MSLEITSPTIAVNTTTKAELLRRANSAIEAGERSLHDAAEALGIADEDHSATQREMAEAVGKSASWVNKLLKWRRSGYTDHSPFGPTTKQGRVEHAQQQAATGPNRRKGRVTLKDADDVDVSAEKRKIEEANQEAQPESRSSTGAQKPISRKWSPAEAKD